MPGANVAPGVLLLREDCMRKLFGKATAVTLFGALAITACGSDDETSPTASGGEATDAPEITPEVVQLTGILLQLQGHWGSSKELICQYSHHLQPRLVLQHPMQ